MQQYQRETCEDTIGIALATAHPSKFKPLVEEVLGKAVDVPDRLAILANRDKKSIYIPAQYEAFKESFLSTVA